jgi:hypothetical protein
MAGWNCNDAETIEWDGTIKVRNNLIVNKRIGVGTATPTQSIDVLGVIRSRTGADGTSGFYATQANPVNTLIMDNNASGSARIVTNSTVPITIGTNLSTTQLYLKEDGNVGIGTTSPTEKLQVEGNQYEQIIINGTTAARSGAIRIYNDVGNYTRIGTFGSQFGVASVINQSFIAAGSSGQDLVFGYGNFGERMRINMSSGNVGIRTSTPTQRLDVSGAIITSGASGAIMFNNSPVFAISSAVASCALFCSGAQLYFTSGAQALKVVLA